MLTSPVRVPRASAKRLWSLRGRLSERDITDLIIAYREGTAAVSRATAHGVSFRSVKRLLRHRRCPPDLTQATSYEGNAGRDASVAASAQAFTARSAACADD